MQFHVWVRNYVEMDWQQTNHVHQLGVLLVELLLELLQLLRVKLLQTVHLSNQAVPNNNLTNKQTCAKLRSNWSNATRVNEDALTEGEEDVAERFICFAFFLRTLCQMPLLFAFDAHHHIHTHTHQYWDVWPKKRNEGWHRKKDPPLKNVQWDTSQTTQTHTHTHQINNKKKQHTQHKLTARFAPSGMNGVAMKELFCPLFLFALPVKRVLLLLLAAVFVVVDCWFCVYCSRLFRFNHNHMKLFWEAQIFLSLCRKPCKTWRFALSMKIHPIIIQMSMRVYVNIISNRMQQFVWCLHSQGDQLFNF